MSIVLNIDVVDGCFGRWKSPKDEDEDPVFIPLGKAVTIETVTRNIESHEVMLVLSHDYLGEKVPTKIPREHLADYALLQDLAKVGADISKKNFDALVDSLRLQEHRMEEKGYGAERVYTHLGWKSMPKLDVDGQQIGAMLCYRAATMLGGYAARYDGPLVVEPKGSFEKWREMVCNDVLGTPALEFVLVVALSAPVNGILAPFTTGENPIVHLYGPSGKGKTTGAMLGASTAGEPFDGERTIIDRYGITTTQMSVYGSWSSTENAIIGQCAGNRGAVVVFNELGKYRGNDLSSLIYNLSEGSDKTRFNKNMEIYRREGYTTSFLSVGEFSIFELCKSKADGLRARVLEIEGGLTTSPEQADTIKAVCRKHNGWAAPMMAEYIITHGGAKKVIEIYQMYRKALSERWPDTPGKERFISKFAALFFTTADIAGAALGIKFDFWALLDFFLAHEASNGANRDSAQAAYETVIETCRVNRNNFFCGRDLTPIRECWGKIVKVNQHLNDGRVVIEEFLVRKPVVNSILKNSGYDSVKLCARRWKELGLTSCDKDRPTRSRKIEPDSDKYEEVFVFRVFEEFADLVDGAEIEYDVLPKKEAEPMDVETKTEPEVYELPKSLIQLAEEEEVASYDEQNAEDAFPA